MGPVCGLRRQIREERFVRILCGIEEADEFVGIKLVRVNAFGAIYNYSVGRER